ncbi:hypothetical protein [uncultured Roseibium sp.]|nr:hypothetical protein [uncultured Roseibium sp.]
MKGQGAGIAIAVVRVTPNGTNLIYDGYGKQQQHRCCCGITIE